MVFDMDDTLYLERDYVRSGFTAVAETAAPLARATVADLIELMWGGFLAGRRGSAFDELLAAYPLLREEVDVSELVHVYREHQPRITLMPGTEPLLAGLRRDGVPVGLISDGALSSQTAKVAALGVGSYADPVLLTDAWGPEWWKPHTRAFEEVARSWDVPHAELVYVADNPAKDFTAPAALGWSSVRLRLPGQLHEARELETPGSAQEVRSVAALAELLRTEVRVP